MNVAPVLKSESLIKSDGFYNKSMCDQFPISSLSMTAVHHLSLLYRAFTLLKMTR